MRATEYIVRIENEWCVSVRVAHHFGCFACEAFACEAVAKWHALMMVRFAK